MFFPLFKSDEREVRRDTGAKTEASKLLIPCYHDRDNNGDDDESVANIVTAARFGYVLSKILI